MENKSDHGQTQNEESTAPVICDAIVVGLGGYGICK
jgi:hypothetical protein